jgi:Mn2+/Fe2+ NRAMP family transporter
VLFFVIRVVLLLIVMFCVLFVCKCVLPPGVNQITVDKYININSIQKRAALSVFALLGNLVGVHLLGLLREKENAFLGYVS